ncbi:MAG: DUF3795 domain-containing protein [Desulfobacterales bacterium]|nr:DUF3795 domain-containing protein [Desulfobacterales bacterium]
MDFLKMTAPCGLDCFNCHFFLAHEDENEMKKVEALAERFNFEADKMLCKGCRSHDGKIPLQMHIYGEKHFCAAYECIKKKGLDFCYECDDFPCDNLHPYADQAENLPHNYKVFNLCLINKMGLEKWANEKSKDVRNDYYNKPWSLSER